MLSGFKPLLLCSLNQFLSPHFLLVKQNGDYRIRFYPTKLYWGQQIEGIRDLQHSKARMEYNSDFQQIFLSSAPVVQNPMLAAALQPIDFPSSHICSNTFVGCGINNK